MLSGGLKGEDGRGVPDGVGDWIPSGWEDRFPVPSVLVLDDPVFGGLVSILRRREGICLGVVCFFMLPSPGEAIGQAATVAVPLGPVELFLSGFACEFTSYDA